jgi:hypothetical protein
MAFACGAGIVGCRDAPAESCAPAAPPADEQIANDLVGVRFVFFEDSTGEKRWTVEEGEVRELRVVDGSTAAGGRRHRARVHLTLAAPNRTISGDLDVYYRRAGARWTFDEAARAGANWSVRELAAVVYDVRRPAPGDTTADGRDVWLEPMFRYHDGAYTAPLSPYAGRVEAIRDSSFASDSLRRAARGALEARVARRYLDPSWTVFLLAPGVGPEPTRIVEREASLWGCTWMVGRARASSSERAEQVRLATSSSTMGGARAPGRELTPQESERLAALARTRLEALGVPADRLRRLRAGRAIAADVDGDGRDEFVGAFGVAGSAGAPDRALVVVGRPAPAAYGAVAERGTTSDEGWGAADLVGVVDVDGDGDLEVIIREAGPDVYRYVVIARRPDGAWEEAFAAGGGGCWGN